MKKILVTGAAGYIGSVLTRQLLEKGYSVVGFDLLKFGGESLLGIYNNPNFKFIRGDIRNENEIKNVLNDNLYAVIHLASIVGDPACAKEPDVAIETNWNASKMIYDVCNYGTNVQRFIFASTCSNYGKIPDDSYVTEESPLNPVSLYAELKVKFESYLLNSETRNDFFPTALRFATVYGISPRMRFDLTVNEFIRDIALGRELKIFGEQFWRPYCHVEDLARACICVLEADKEKVNHQVFNVGDTNENYTKKMIADEILKIEPNASISYIHKAEDPRDYKVNFSKINKTLNFFITKKVPDGLREIYEIIKKGVISDVDSENYKNI